jgi:hypothetical protein
MKKLLLWLLLYSNLAFGELISKYHNPAHQPEMEALERKHTLKRAPEGVIPIEFKTFREIGLNYPLLNKLAKEKGAPAYQILELDPKEYIASSSRKNITIRAVEEIIEIDELRAKYVIRMPEDRIRVGVHFEATSAGSNTAYKTTAFIQPDSITQRTLLKIISLFPSFDRIVDEKISDIATTTEEVFIELRENPQNIERKLLTREEKDILKKAIGM